MSEFIIRKLVEADAEIYREIRLEMLNASPSYFGTSYEDSIKEDITFFEDRIKYGNIYGYFNDNHLGGVVGCYQKQGLKVKHIAGIWGVYVRPPYRGKSIAYKLTEVIISELPKEIELIQVSVTKGNFPAQKTYEKSGFKIWGIEEKALKIKKDYFDVINMVKFLNDK